MAQMSEKEVEVDSENATLLRESRERLGEVQLGVVRWSVGWWVGHSGSQF